MMCVCVCVLLSVDQISNVSRVGQHLSKVQKSASQVVISCLLKIRTLSGSASTPALFLWAENKRCRATGVYIFRIVWEQMGSILIALPICLFVCSTNIPAHYLSFSFSPLSPFSFPALFFVLRSCRYFWAAVTLYPILLTRLDRWDLQAKNIWMTLVPCPSLEA